MKSYLIRRAGSTAVTLFLVTIIVFLLTRWLPFDPVAVKLGAGSGGSPVPESVRAAMISEMGLHRPLLVQYGSWLLDLVRGDLGVSWMDGETVTKKLARSFPITAELGLVGLLLASLVGFPLAIASARRPGGSLDRLSSGGALFLFSLPSFWIAIVLIDLLVLRLRLLPLYGPLSSDAAGLGFAALLLDHFHHLLLPAVVVAMANVAILIRFVRASILEQLGEEYIRAARARGLRERDVLLRHAMRNAAVPLVTLMVLLVPVLLSGSAIVERIFQWDGLGNLMFEAVAARDYPVVMGLTLFGAVITVIAGLVGDLLYAMIDPRVRLERQEP